MINCDIRRFLPDIPGFWPWRTTINTDKHRRSRFSGTINYDKRRYIRMNQGKLLPGFRCRFWIAVYEPCYFSLWIILGSDITLSTCQCIANYMWRRTHLDPALHAGRDRQEGDCNSPGPAATEAERPDVFQPQVQEVQTMVGSAVAHTTTEGKERPISPAFEAQVVSCYRPAVLRQLPPNACWSVQRDRGQVTQLIQTQKTNWRDSLHPALKVAITLRHLATGKISRFSSPINDDFYQIGTDSKIGKKNFNMLKFSPR